MHSINFVEEQKSYYGVLYYDIKKHLEKWYNNLLETKSKYIVFATPRSYNTAMLMECVTGKSLRDNTKHVILTDESILNYYNILSNESCPEITLVDDYIEHGRTANDIYSSISSIVKDNKDIELTALSIPNDNLCIFNGGIERSKKNASLKAGKSETYNNFNHLAYYICNNMGYTNNLTLPSERIPEDIIDKIKSNSDYIVTNYMHIWNLTKTEFIREKDSVKVALSLRVTTMNGLNRIAPFIILPTLSEEETDKIVNIILNKIGTNKDKYAQFFEVLRNVPGKRCYKDIILLILNNVLLQEFNRKFEFTPDEDDFLDELDRLTISYITPEYKDTTAEILKELLTMNIFTLEELKQTLDSCINSDNTLLKINNGMHHKDVSDIIEELNNKIYERYYKDEKVIIDLYRAVTFDKSAIQKRQVYNLGDIFTDLMGPHDEENTKQIIAIVLQMANRGIIEISSNPKIGKNTVNLKQYITIGRIASVILPLKYFIYRALLKGMEKYCNDWGESFEKVLLNYCKKYNTDVTGDEILKYMGKLKEIGQSPKTFDGKYSTAISIPGEYSSMAGYYYTSDILKQEEKLLEQFK